MIGDPALIKCAEILAEAIKEGLIEAGKCIGAGIAASGCNGPTSAIGSAYGGLSDTRKNWGKEGKKKGENDGD